jgi:hypothetical protein
MGSNNLTPDELHLVGRCLVAAVDGPFFPDWEFHTLFGVTRAGARAVASAWPEVDELEEVVAVTVNNSFINLLGYPHGEAAAWDRLVGATREEVERVFLKWLAATTRTDPLA